MPRSGQYAVVLLHNDRVFRVFGPVAKNKATSIRANCKRHWGSGSGYDAKVIMHWDWNPDADDKDDDE